MSNILNSLPLLYLEFNIINVFFNSFGFEKILKQQEQHSKDIRVVVLFLFAMVIIVLPIIALWYYFNP
jgi:uncharacterized membrane protein